MREVNITAKNTAVTLSVEDKTQGASGLLSLDSNITANTIYVKSGNWSLRSASLTTLQIDGGGSLRLSDLASVTNLVIGENARLVTDSMVQGSKGKTQLAPGSVLAVKKKAVLYNPVLTAGEKDAHLYFAADAALEIQGKLTRDTEDVFLSLGLLDGDSDIQCADFTKETKLFSTKIKNFPVEALHMEQGSESSGSIYNMAYQIGNSVYVGAQWFAVYARGVDGTETKLASFTKWTETAAYLNTLSNASMTYIVEILENVDTKGALTMPAKAKGIVFRSARKKESGGLENITLKAVGDVKLSADMTFESVDLELTKYNSKTKTYIPAAMTLNGKTLTFENSSAGFASVAGTNISALIVEGGGLSVTGAVTKLGRLTLRQASLTAGSSVEVTDTLVMKSSVLESVSKINIKNLVSEDNGNRIAYGGNAKGNILTITGTVTAPEEWDADQEVSVGEASGSGEKAVIRKAAVSLEPKAPTESKTGEILLCNAAKAGAGWFVMGNQPQAESGWKIKSAAYKSGNGIYKGGSLKAVRLMAATGSGEDYSFDSSFATLQEALSEIDRLADAGQYYRIELHTDRPEDVTFGNKALTLPSKTAGVTIVFTGEENREAGNEDLGCLYYKGVLTLKSNLELVHIKLCPSAKAAISLGKFKLALDGCEVDEASGISGITGSGVAATSELMLKNMQSLTVLGNVDKVGSIRLTDTVLTAQGTVNVGRVTVKGETEIAGLAKVTRDKAGVITKVDSKITIQSTVDSLNNSVLKIRLLEKSGTEYREVDFEGENAKNILAQGVNMAKAPLADGSVVRPINSGLVREGTPLASMKAGGYLTCYGDNRHGAVLCYGEQGEGQRILCRTFGDAVTEINNYKVKRAYTIEVTQDAMEIGEAAPKALTMPNKNYIASLLITGAGESQGEAANLPYMGNISFTSDTVLRNVSFKQRVKSGSVYTDPIEAAGAVTVSTGGFALTIEGDVSFNTPLALAGGNKGILTLQGSGRLRTFTNGYERKDQEDSKSVLYGTISKFAGVNVKSQLLELREYRKNAKEANPSRAASLAVTDMKLSSGGCLVLAGDHARGSVTVKNLTMDSADGEVSVEASGKVSLTNVDIKGNKAVSIRADQDFTVSGKLNNAASDVTLVTRLRGAGKAPYLTINATVKTERPIMVGILAGLTSDDPTQYVKLSDAPKVTGQLLTAKTAPASAFLPCAENTAGKGEYGADNQDGYMVMKVGTGIYVYDGSQVYVALCKGNYSDSSQNGNNGNLTKAEKAGELLGYYTDLKTVSAAVDALKDTSASYTLILTRDIGRGTSPAAVTLPSRAGVVYVTSLTGNSNKAIVFSGNIALKSDIVFDEVDFAPVGKKKNKFYGVSNGFAAGGFDLTLKNVGILDSGSDLLNGVEDRDAIALKDISGNGRGTVTLDSAGLTLSGGVTKAKTLTVTENAEIKGIIKASALELSKGAELAAGGTITLDTVKASKGDNTLTYTRTVKNATNLTINKRIEKTDGGNLILNMNVPGKDASDFVLKLNQAEEAGKPDKAVLSDSLKLAIMPLADTGAYVQYMNGEVLAEETGVIVKANKGIYLAETEALAPYRTTVSDDSGRRTDCLDYQQAVNEINNRSVGTANYTIEFLNSDSLNTVDTNLTDNARYSAFGLPAKNKAASVTVDGRNTEISFVNHISGTGTVTLKKLVLNPVNAKGQPAACNITVGKDSKTAELHLEEVSVSNGTEPMARLNQITGAKNVTKVEMKDCDSLLLKKGISNIGDLELYDTSLFCGGGSAIRKLSLIGQSSLHVFGKTTLETLDTSQAENGQDKSRIGTRLEKGVPVLTLNGQVQGGPVHCTVYTADSDIFNPREVEAYIGKDSDVPLITAKKASAESFVIARYASLGSEQYITEEGMQKSKLISYKDGSYVKNGNIDHMAVKITPRYENRLGTLGASYARSFDEAVTAIDSAADTSMYYDLELLGKESQEGRWIKTTKKGTAFGALTLPSKAAGLTIRSSDASSPSILAYTGTLKASCEVTFADILLTEGTVKKNVFTPSYQITPAPQAKGKITFMGTAETLAQGEDIRGAGALVMASVSGSRGGMELCGGKAAEVKGAVALADLTLTEGASVKAGGKVTVTNLYAGEAGEDNNLLYSPQAVTITNIYNSKEGADGGTLEIGAHFTAMKKQNQRGNTQLAINGEIGDVAVGLTMYLKEPESDYRKMDGNDYEKLWAAGAGKPAAYQKIASMPKAGLEHIELPINGGTTLFKYDGGLYVTDQVPVVRVTGERDTNPVYQAEFLEWEQAVKEIDKIANMNHSYTIELLETAGVKGNDITPVSAVTLPARAKEVLVKASAGEEKKGIFFTGAKITLKCPVTVEGIGLMRVSRNSKTKRYEAAAYTVNTGNFAFTLRDPLSSLNGMTANPGTITGSARGSFTFCSREEGALRAPALKITNVGTVTLQNGSGESGAEDGNVTELFVENGISGVTTLNLESGIRMKSTAAVSVKNLVLTSGALEAKNITVSTLAELCGASELKAGTKAIGDGRITLNNVRVQGGENTLLAKQDKNGNTLLTINGKLTGVSESGRTPVRVGLYYNNQSGFAQLYDGMALGNAKNAAADAGWFVPYYTDVTDEPSAADGMGYKQESFGIYKKKNVLYYGAL